jgi:hypothetical protein
MWRRLGNAGGSGFGGAAADEAARNRNGNELKEADDEQGITERESVGNRIRLEHSELAQRNSRTSSATRVSVGGGACFLIPARIPFATGMEISCSAPTISSA